MKSREKKNRKSRLIARLSATILAIIVVVSYTLNVFAQTASQAQYAAKASSAMKVLKDCIAAEEYNPAANLVGNTTMKFELDDVALAMNSGGNSYYFKEFGLGTNWMNQIDIAAGAWAERNYAGGYSDGKVWCYELNDHMDSLLQDIANGLGIDVADIKCNGSAPGMMQAVDYSGSTLKRVDYGCGDGDKNMIISEDALAYLQDLWDKNKDKNGLADWGALGSGYYSLYNDWYTQCVNDDGHGASNMYNSASEVKQHYGDYYTVQVYESNSKGPVTKYVGNKSGKSSATAWGGIGSHTCKEMADLLNALAQDLEFETEEEQKHEAVEEIKNDVAEETEVECRTKTHSLITQYSNILQYSKDDGERQRAKESLDKINETLNLYNGKYSHLAYSGNGKDVYECVIDGIDFSKTVDEDGNVTTDDNGEVTTESKYEDTTPDIGRGDTNDLQEQACYDKAGSLGWVICPMIFGMNGFIQDLYEEQIEPLLRTDKSIVEQFGDNSSPVYEIWGNIRNVANVIFVIVLLIIVLSQVTGFGIDNFGIKRMLPKLIIAAVLVNLSFIIFALVVDVTNIVGGSIYKMFVSFGDKLPIGFEAQGVSGGASFITVIVYGLIAALTGAGIAAAVGTIASGAGWLIVLPLLLLLLSAVIAVLFLFVVLGIRQAVIIMLVVISPIAMVLYILPNTNMTFRKWAKIALEVLFMYPMASLLIGGGYLAAKLLISVNQDNYIMYLIAGLLSIAPYFFIPTLATNALKGLGNIGARISSLGSSLGRRATGGLDRAARGTNTFQNALQNRVNGSALRNARRDFNRFTEVGRNGKRVARGDLSRNQMRRLAAASNVLAENDESVLGSKANMGVGGIESGSLAADFKIAEEEKAIKAQESLLDSGAFMSAADGSKVDGNSVDDMKKALIAELSQDADSVDATKIKALQNKLSAQGDAGRTAVVDAMQKAEGRASAKARQAYSENIMSKWAKDYKDNHRSAFNFAQANATANGPDKQEDTRMSTFQAHDRLSYGSLKGSTIGDMDDKEFDRFVGKDGDGNFTFTQQGSAALNTESGQNLNSALTEALGRENPNLKASRANDMAKAYCELNGITGKVNNGNYVAAARAHIEENRSSIQVRGGGSSSGTPDYWGPNDYY